MSNLRAPHKSLGNFHRKWNAICIVFYRLETGQETIAMYYLYGSKRGENQRLVATFDSEQQLRAYVGWATLRRNEDGSSRFEQGSVLAPYQRWNISPLPSTDSDPELVAHNPSPSML
ncbi:MAG: hypothetical protein AB7O26_09135 [Planctomycetaceae bacterium]